MAHTTTSAQKTQMEILSTGTMTEATAGAGAVILGILALINVLPLVFLAIATIAVGAGLFFQGSMISAEYSKLLDHAGGGEVRNMNISGGLRIEVISGGIGAALGVLGLIGLAPHILLPVAAIVLGCGVAMSSSTISQLNSLKVMHSGADQTARHIAGGAVGAASGAQVLIGLGGAVLGLLAIIGVADATVLTIIAVLALGLVTTLTGLSLSGRAFKTL